MTEFLLADHTERSTSDRGLPHRYLHFGETLDAFLNGYRTMGDYTQSSGWCQPVACDCAAGSVA